MSSSEIHPGYYIRENVLPKGMSVTKAAKLLGVGRPALSNLLNGNASLSANMAARIEKAFGADARKLTDMQAAYDTAIAIESGAAASSRPYVPVFLQFKASDFEDWADSISARSRLAVLLRTLVHSTGSQLVSADFPGNDDSERPGWDGFVEANAIAPWVPMGKSGWEFGVNRDPKQKADGDYEKSVRAVPSRERKDITFVFVTPRRWVGKKDWQRIQKAKKEWKDVRVYDASDLEQWLEQSIPGQAWFANERYVPSEGLLSLDTCWQRWLADCTPPLTEALFTEALAHKKQGLIAKLSNPAEPVTIVADSRDEALAFLHCLFSSDLAAIRDRVIVFTEPGALTKLASKSANFIPVVTTPAVEKEFAPHRAELQGILVFPRNTANVEADITLEPLSYAAFEKALQQMGCSRDDIQRLSQESGRSLTILRRRLSKLPAIKTPEWANDTRYAASLVPFLFAGAWKTNSEADQIIVSFLAHEMPYRTLEGLFSTLLQLEDSPVWAVGSYHGLVSKMDALFAIRNSIQRADIDTFFGVAELVLSEVDPSLELPEEKRWMASVYGKVRDTSSTLREGICETLVLLSVYGPDLFFKERLGIDTAVYARKLVRTLLTPLTVTKLEAQSNELPMYAEASPEEFLDILETDLASSDPESLKLMRPVSPALFGRCYRTGLLEALENIAWSPEHLVRVVSILGRLAEYKIQDKWVNKPITSLSALFLYQMPQTAASIEKRKAAMKHLINKHPQVAWDICVAQFSGQMHFGHYSHKPRWRPDARGHGEAVPNPEAREFMIWALESALNWKKHSRETLGDLVACTLRLPSAYQLKIWDFVDQWSKEASDEDRAWLREKIRTSAKMKYTPQEGTSISQDEACIARACRAYKQLRPTSLLLEHAWLFKKSWVEHSADERWSERTNSTGREEYLNRTRIDALQEIIARYGIDGVLELTEMGQAGWSIGFLLLQIFKGEDEQLNTFQQLINSRPAPHSASWRLLVSGFLDNIPENHFSRIIAEIPINRQPAEIVSLLLLAPFQRRTWHFVDTLGDDITAAYWKDVSPTWGPYSAEDMCLGADLLLRAGRSYAAFGFVGHRLEELPPKMLFRIMKAMPADPSGKSDSYSMQSYDVAEAFKLLHQSGEISVNEMATLEFQYLDVLDPKEYGMPNLARQIEDNPDLFVHALCIVYRRDDGVEDSVALGATGPEQMREWAKAAANLLNKFERIPGCDKYGEIDATRLSEWVSRVRTKCKELARSEIGDYRIGKILSKAPIGKDAVWPCEPVRDVLEDIANTRITEGVTNGLYNARGVHGRDPRAGGIPERELSAKYSAWAEALDFTHREVAKILREMVRIYDHQASWEDTEAGARQRLG